MIYCSAIRCADWLRSRECSFPWRKKQLIIITIITKSITVIITVMITVIIIMIIILIIPFIFCRAKRAAARENTAFPGDTSSGAKDCTPEIEGIANEFM